MSVIMFNSTHHALEAEHLLEGEGYEIDIVAPPEKLKAECGLAIRIAEADRAIVEKLLVSEGIRFSGIAD